MTSFAYMATSTEPPRRTCVQVNGYALREIRERTSVTRPDFARQVGLDLSYVSRIERGERTNVAVDKYGEILRALGITDRRTLLVNPHVTPDPPDDTAPAHIEDAAS